MCETLVLPIPQNKTEIQARKEEKFQAVCMQVAGWLSTFGVELTESGQYLLQTLVAEIHEHEKDNYKRIYAKLSADLGLSHKMM